MSSLSALAMGLCVSMIAYIRLPSLKVSTLLLIGLLIYDVFWVSFRDILSRHPDTAAIVFRLAFYIVAFGLV